MKPIFQEITGIVDFKDKVILDAGSGLRSLEFLLSQSPKYIYSVSIDPNEVSKNKEKYGSDERIEFIEADLTKEMQFKSRADVILADYFFAGVEGYKPGSSPGVINNFKGILTPNGLVVAVGWEPLPSPLNKEETAIKDLVTKRDYVKSLLKEPVYKERECKELTEMFEHSGYSVLHTISDSMIFTQNFFDNYLASIKKRINKIEDAPEQKKMIEWVTDFENRISSFSLPISYGNEYALIIKES